MQTPAEVRDYLRERRDALGELHIDADPVATSGGNLNHVWRVPARPRPLIVKHAPGHVAVHPDIELAPGRLAFEARALALLDDRLEADGAPTPHIELDDAGLHDLGLCACAGARARPPTLRLYDAAQHVIVMEDLGPLEGLGDALRPGHHRPERAGALGAALGHLVGCLHRRSAPVADRLRAVHDNRDVQRTRMEVQYRRVAEMLEVAGLDDADALGAGAERVGASFLEPGVCMIMGDLWPPSALVTPDDDLRLIDWEFSHVGRPEQDVAHLLAHLWMHADRAEDADHRSRVERCRDGFVDAWRRAIAPAADALLDEQTELRASVHLGAEILMRAVGPFQQGYLYEGRAPDDEAVRRACAHAASCLREPTLSPMRIPG